MDFSVSDKVKALRGTLREFMKHEVLPLEHRLLRGEHWSTLGPLLDEKRARARQTGFWRTGHAGHELGAACVQIGERADSTGSHRACEGQHESNPWRSSDSAPR